MTPLDKSLHRLAQAAQALNERADAANKLIAAVNARASKLTPGVEVWLLRGEWPLLLAEDNLGSEFSLGNQLGYAKVDDVWQLAVRFVEARQRYFEGDESQPFTTIDVKGPPRPLVDASRVVRVAAVQHLDAVMDALAERIEGYLAGLDRAERGDST